MHAYHRVLPHVQCFQTEGEWSTGRGIVYNIVSNTWEEPDAEEKEMLLGYSRGDTAAVGVSDEERSIRIGRALDATTMR